MLGAVRVAGGMLAEPCWEVAGVTACCPAPPTHPPARISQDVCGMQLRMLLQSRHRGFPLWGLHGVLGTPPALPTSQAGGRPCLESWGWRQL